MSEIPRSNFKPRKISQKAYAAIGRIVRACAELEDMLTLFICNLAGVNESRAIILLGRSPFSARKNIAQYLAKLLGGEALERYKTVFESKISNGTECRNAIAHGVYLGMNDQGRYGFLTAKTAEPENGATIQIVLCYSPKTLEDIATALERLLPSVEAALKIEPLRERRQKQSLERHRKGQNKQKQNAKRKHPPRS